MGDKGTPIMYKKLGELARDLEEYDKQTDEEISRRLRFTKKEVHGALQELKRLW